MTWDGQGDDPWLPARLDALTDAALAERDIRRAFWAVLSDWLVQTSRRVMRGDAPPDTDAIWARAPAWREAVDLVIQGHVLKALGLAYRKLLGDDYAWQHRTFVTSYLAEVRNRLVRLPDEVFDLVAGQVSQGTNLGEGIPEIAKRVDTVLSTTASERWRNRATTVARTECLPATAPVNGAYVTAAYRRWYSGPMVTVKTVGGREFTGTPNHPVLASWGWTGLGDLAEGDRLLCDRLSVQLSGAPGDEDVQAGPTTIGEIFDALQAVGVTRRERTAQPDFHGDRPEGDVEILGSFGVLSFGRFAKIEERSVHGILSPSELAQVTLACERAPFARGDSIDQATGLLRVPPRDTGIGHDPADHLEVSAVNVREGLPRFSCPVPGHDLLARQIGPEGRVLTALLEETLASAGQVALDTLRDNRIPDAVGGESGLGGDLPVAEPGQIEVDRVVSVEVSEWSGHVFNLTTVNGYFVSGGVFTGNTIGALNAGRMDAFRAAAEAEPDIEFEKVWLAAEDTRTRETHREADGQRVPLESPFSVGGFDLRFPGDPTGPAQEVINCRCTLLLVERGEFVDLSDRQMKRSRR